MNDNFDEWQTEIYIGNHQLDIYLGRSCSRKDLSGYRCADLHILSSTMTTVIYEISPDSLRKFAQFLNDYADFLEKES